MIGHLKGVLLSSDTDPILVDVQGVGYEVSVSETTKTYLSTQTNVSLWIYTAVREDQIALYGFLSLEEKEIFLLMISVSGIGPKLGLSILSKIRPEQLQEIILSRSVERLVAIPGIGKKTAERIIVELKDKILKISSSKNFSSTTYFPAEEDVRSALLRFGYQLSAIEKIIPKLISENLSVEEMIKKGLKLLSNG